MQDSGLASSFPKEGTDELPKDGFDWIAIKVSFQGPKGLKKSHLGILLFFCKISQKLFHNFVIYSFLGLILINLQELWLNNSKCHFQFHKGQFWPIFTELCIFFHATLCCQWYDQVRDISISPDWHQYFLIQEYILQISYIMWNKAIKFQIMHSGTPLMFEEILVYATKWSWKAMQKY